MNIMSVRKTGQTRFKRLVPHDKNGNVTVMPGLSCKYDAWNCLVEVGSNIRYDYNGLNQRVRKTVNNVTITSFFNSQWQELESQEPRTCGRHLKRAARSI